MLIHVMVDTMDLGLQTSLVILEFGEVIVHALLYQGACCLVLIQTGLHSFTMDLYLVVYLLDFPDLAISTHIIF